MTSLAIISDDFTGALDTGVQFTNYGAAVRVLTCRNFYEQALPLQNADVLVIDAEMRHLSPEKAYRITYDLVKQIRRAEIPYLYVKTDSGLRGNIGSTLKAVLDAAEINFLPFMPAYPDMNRITKNGVHFIDGVPIHRSAFGEDPFDPVRSPYVKDLFDGLPVQAVNIGVAETYHTSFDRPTIAVFDASTNHDFRRIASHLKATDGIAVTAGCAGFAAVLPEFIPLNRRTTDFIALREPLLIVSGSLNPITRKQIEYAQEHGFQRVVLEPEQLLLPEYFTSSPGTQWIESFRGLLERGLHIMVDTGISSRETMNDYMRQNDIDFKAVRKTVPKAIGRLLRMLFELGYISGHTLMIIGGDTLLGFIEQVPWEEISPIRELMPGTVLFSIRVGRQNILVISKSGGFGREDLLEQIASELELDCMAAPAMKQPSAGNKFGIRGEQA